MSYLVDQLEHADANTTDTVRPNLCRKTEPPRISRGVIMTGMASNCITCGPGLSLAFSRRNDPFRHILMASVE